MSAQAPPFAATLVLIVDDDEDVREMVELTLTLEGFDTETASDGIDALDRLRTGRAPSLVLLDLRMPRMNGLELLKVVKREAALASIPIVVLTADAASTAAALAAGATACLAKPLEVEDLIAAVRRHSTRPGRAAA